MPDFWGLRVCSRLVPMPLCESERADTAAHPWSRCGGGHPALWRRGGRCLSRPGGGRLRSALRRGPGEPAVGGGAEPAAGRSAESQGPPSVLAAGAPAGPAAGEAAAEAECSPVGGAPTHASGARTAGRWARWKAPRLSGWGARADRPGSRSLEVSLRSPRGQPPSGLARPRPPCRGLGQAEGTQK